MTYFRRIDRSYWWKSASKTCFFPVSNLCNKCDYERPILKPKGQDGFWLKVDFILQNNSAYLADAELVQLQNPSNSEGSESTHLYRVYSPGWATMPGQILFNHFPWGWKTARLSNLSIWHPLQWISTIWLLVQDFPMNRVASASYNLRARLVCKLDWRIWEIEKWSDCKVPDVNGIRTHTTMPLTMWIG